MLVPVEQDEASFPAERNVIEESDRFLITYCRATSEKKRELEEALLRYCNCDETHTEASVYCSGMNAICALIQNTMYRLNANEVSHAERPLLVFGDEMYCDVKRIVVYFSKIFRFEYQFLDIRDTGRLLRLFEQESSRVALLFVESCTNPSGQMMDFDCIARLKRIAPKCVVCVDNTWLSHVLFQPLRYGADLVLESMTKYVSGSRAIGGMIVGRKRLINDLKHNWIRIYGQYLLPRHCQYFIDALGNIEERVKRSARLTSAVAAYLESHRSVNRVLHPLLESHPTYATNVRLLQSPERLGPSVLLFHVSMKVKDRESMYKYFERSPLKLETSYGSSYTKLDPWAKSGPVDKYEAPKAAAASDERRKKKKRSESGQGLWIRLALGYDDTLKGVIEGLLPLIGDH